MLSALRLSANRGARAGRRLCPAVLDHATRFATQPFILPTRSRLMHSEPPQISPYSHHNEPSNRRPELRWTRNYADIIERQLHEDGHILWGFVIYRSTYANDAQWNKAIDMLLTRLKEDLQQHNGLNIFERFRLTIFERPEYNGATTSIIRNAFKAWRVDAERQEQGLHCSRPMDYPPNGSEAGAMRYRFCIQIDEDAMLSILSQPVWGGWVKLIRADWEIDVEEDDDLDEIEGCIHWDVGEMRVHYHCVMTSWYRNLRQPHTWSDHEY